MNDVLIACALSDADLRESKDGFLRQTAKSIISIEELENGFRCLFPAEDLVLQELLHIINLERKFCPFIDARSHGTKQVLLAGTDRTGRSKRSDLIIF